MTINLNNHEQSRFNIEFFSERVKASQEGLNSTTPKDLAKLIKDSLSENVPDASAKTAEAVHYMLVRDRGLSTVLNEALNELVQTGEFLDEKETLLKSVHMPHNDTPNTLSKAKLDYANATLASRYPDFASLTSASAKMSTAFATVGLFVRRKMAGVELDDLGPNLPNVADTMDGQS